ncbi:3-deoxy-D-manno-octulosonic acid transferase [Ancylobacter lacus]|uniref:3-deoxy-D-manno-octulosonic acid transferase n=1 Tax=Ancylobacter lacus TaxID=2579970 RepID=UPI001BCFB107|nr:3-deoxy-D-manno-octulosonic acid transferase [Ancylobacter lacus]MBS7539650.1 3-deoxy-D-manno-octulosonic acid transferase [Ancylobacter lacus]
MAEARTTLPIRLYRLGMRLATPFARLALMPRVRRGKEDPARLRERFGIASAPRPRGPLVWVHGASVGEVIAVLPLLDRLRGRGFEVLLTSGTVTSARLAASRLPPGIVHQFVPLDAPAFLRRFLGHWRPNLVLLVESELWPTLLVEVNARGIPLLLVNARMSARSFERWQKTPRSVRALLSRVDLCLAQAREDGDRLARLGAPRVSVTGNLKFDAPPPPVAEDALAALRRAIGTRPVFLAASTHPGEEEAVLAAHARLRATMPELLTIVAPRHPERGADVVRAATEAGLPAVLRSDGYLPDRGTQIYVADTIGELGLFYRVAPLAFIGGSLVRHGGQNPIEPIRLGCAVVHGPHVMNFQDIYSRLNQNYGAETVTSAEELFHQVHMLFGDQGRRSRTVDAGRATLAALGGGLDRTLAAIDPYLVQIRLERH